MAGVSVTLLRIERIGSGNPIKRVFEKANSWIFADDFLHIIQEISESSKTDFKRTTIAEFPVGGVESVEFV